MAETSISEETDAVEIVEAEVGKRAAAAAAAAAAEKQRRDETGAGQGW